MPADFPRCRGNRPSHQTMNPCCVPPQVLELITVVEVMDHLRLSPLVAESHHGERLTHRRAQALGGDEPPLQVAKPGSSPKPDLVDPTTAQRFARTLHSRVECRV